MYVRAALVCTRVNGSDQFNVIPYSMYTIVFPPYRWHIAPIAFVFLSQKKVLAIGTTDTDD